ncbi:DUF3046 domain-containing protein [Demequina sp. TTPB684]|uniref:DUF3046 domain-containing protein n=1 Tax=unclassified Demequina TaxID=2620311 RepID=UPI001CF5BBB9|nr:MULTISPECIES: DUF3046 domain-containing protein [unclassified Demequina]MCB2413731.1 DUF3046 domain-containing protein [Demequina sp. TTPB684]UPU89598.1 DUF3046 domain-containing protein [Demequina sp. TMPB413]
MRLSEFRDAVAAAFGESYAPTLCREMALTSLDSLTAQEALERGVAPRDVWHALCDQMDVDAAVRAGRDPRMIIPPRR